MGGWLLGSCRCTNGYVVVNRGSSYFARALIASPQRVRGWEGVPDCSQYGV